MNTELKTEAKRKFEIDFFNLMKCNRNEKDKTKNDKATTFRYV